MNERQEIDTVAEAIYNAHWGESLRGKFPPCWVDVTLPVRDFVRAQAIAAMRTYDRILLEESYN